MNAIHAAPDAVKVKRIVLVTGGAGVIGSAICALFAKRGATVLAADVGGKQDVAGAERVHLDVTDEAHWSALLGEIDAKHGGLDVLVNGAGVHVPNIAFGDLSLDVWRRHFAVNADGVFLGCKHGIRHMAANGRGGAIVNLASGLALKARATSAAYCASKAAALMTTRAAAKAAGPHGVRINAILPGPIISEMLMSNRVPGQSEEAFLDPFIAGAPLGRLATPADIAEAVAFLCSDAAAAITGVSLPVDGGDMPGS